MSEANEEAIINKLDEILAMIDNGADITTIEHSIEELRLNIANYQLDIEKGVLRNTHYNNMISILIQHYTITISIVGSDFSRNTATCFFLKIDDTVYVVTNRHVIDYYDQKIKKDPRAFFQIGEYKFPIKNFLVDSNQELDLAIIKIPEEHIEELILKQDKLFLELVDWPLSKPCKGDIVFLSGYPAVFREDEKNGFNIFFVSITEPIEDVATNKSIITFDRDQWVKTMGLKDPSQLNKVGGFSGGPAFVCRDGKLDLVGVICQNGGSFFDMQIVHAIHIQKDGTISYNDKYYLSAVRDDKVATTI